MRIRKLKLTGFKSFVDPAELVIEKGLTGIVGPNGCGKSNLLEAIRWVMGEASAKSLRGGGMEDVIFAGTTARPARDFAEVSILLDQLDGRDAEVVRRIERGAGSAYRIDGRDVRQKDVALLFADAATGAHSPALVSQGRIGAIIAAKPVDRRAMLEEAAGIAGLHVRRRDAELKLRATETNLERLDTLLGDMEARATALRRQARAAERYRLLSVEIRIAEGRLIYARWRDAAAQAEKAKREAEVAEAAVATTADQQRRATEAVGQATMKVAAARSAAQAAREVVASAGHRLQTLRSELEALHRRIADVARLRDTLEHDRAREGALAEDAANAIARLTEEAETLAARATEAEASRPALASRLAEAEVTLRDAEVALAQALAAEAAEQAEARIARAALSSVQQRLSRAEGEVARIARDAAQVGDAAQHEAELKRSILVREAAEAEAATAGETIATAEVRRMAALADRDAAQAAVAAARADLASLESEAAALSRSLAKRDGKAKAIDRITAAPGYERALAAALGDDLEAPIGAGAVRWAGADAKGDPALPAGCMALADHVEAPAELARRLAQVGVVDADDGSILLDVGQRLVTRDGRLRRWDGFIAEDRGAAAAEGLIRRNRLVEIERLVAPARDAVTSAEAALTGISVTLDTAQREGQAARTAQQAAERRARDEAMIEGRARVAIERVESRRAELAERAKGAEAERAEAADEVQRAEQAVLALPDGGETARGVATQRAATDAARAAVGQYRVDLAALDRGLAADRDRAVSARAEAKGWNARAGDAAKRIKEMTARAAAANDEAELLAPAPKQVETKIAAAETEREDAAKTGEATALEERQAEALLREAERVAADAGEAAASAREARATAVARHENHELRRVEMGRVSGERFECPAPVLPEKVGFDSKDVGEAGAESARFDRLNLDRERIGPVNLIAEQELAELDAERTTQAAQRDELAEAVSRLRGSIGSLNREGRARLLAAFEAVDGHFRRLFTRLFAGGEAHLALVDSDDPLEAGLEIMAQPPGKKLASLTLLSGGEQALTAVALIFALFLTNPAPICVLDEVDAPLDDANIERFCDLLDQMVQETDTRYLVVTHNAVSMARMHRLFGVTMVERGVSRLVSVDLGGAESLLAAE
ncbi:chromosome segregation protein SMC [Sphingomonas sp. CGMCC 1.13654]|uniref:Chromosome partition protein Smc n=1 Tax=Sphingomonas chungangi TaxID=2683589 RepID=A0A838L0F5_9SPHN|nr:chromosome segregation protein SMC [Sphingomonas chungangi]MBA2932821.1 chromosome segregation protein SMC [Sphingomonas chungangi]MVW56443.1 chromosome segregation protein SMC [Sphingomonas chungangi]